MKTYNSGKRKLDPEKITGRSTKRQLDPAKISYDAARVYDLERRSGADTLEQDAKSLRSSLGSISSGWQNEDSMERRGQELASIQDRLSARRQYLSVAQMFPDDFGITSDQSETIQHISDLENDFRNISDSFDSLKQAYGAFSSADEYNKAVETQKAYYDKWGHFADEADFEEYVQAGEKASKKPDAILKNVPFIFQKDAQMQNIANVTGIANDFMSDDERNIYNYLWGKEGEERAQEYLEDIQSTRNYRAGAQAAKDIQGINSTFLKSLAHAGYSILGGLDQATTGMAQIGEDSQITSPVAVTNSELVNDLDGFGKDLYQAGNTVGNMLPSLAISAVTGGTLGTVSMGLSAGGNAYGEALAQGYSKGQAALYGTLVGASEAALEKVLGGIPGLRGFGTEKWLSKIAKIDNAFARVALSMGADMTSEIIEEEAQNFLEPLFKTVLFNEDYDAPALEELVETAVVTMLSTGAMSGPSTIVNDNRVNTFKDAQLDMQYSGHGEAFGTALENVLGKERAAEAQNGTYLPTVRETKVIQKESGVSSEQIQSGLNEYGAELMQEAEKIKPGSRNAAKIREELSKNNGQVTGRAIDKLTRENESVMRGQDKPVIRDAAGERLAELGETREQIPVIASAISKQVAGEKLTAQERKAIDGSTYGIRVANELNPENAGTGLYSNAYIDDIEPTRFYASYHEGIVHIPSPTIEPVIGVIDTLFDTSVYFQEWVEYHDMVDDNIPSEIINTEQLCHLSLLMEVD